MRISAEQMGSEMGKTLGQYAREMRAVEDLPGVLDYYLTERARAGDALSSPEFAKWFCDLVVTILNHDKLPLIWSRMFALETA